MAKESYLRFLRFLLKPIVRFCLRRSVTFQETLQVLRATFVELTAEDMRKSNQKVNASRISMISGIYREDVAKILRNEVPPITTERGLLAEVIGQWEQDPEFTTSQGQPRVLPFDDEKSGFFRLVNKVRKGVYPPTVLFALERATAVKRTSRGLKLVRGGTVADPASEDSLDLLSRDIEAFIQATEQNIERRDAIGEAYIRTEYDNISQKHLPEIRRWLVAHTRVFHKKARTYLSRFDHDLNPKLKGKDHAGERVILHAFSLSRPTPGEPEIKK